VHAKAKGWNARRSIFYFISSQKELTNEDSDRFPQDAYLCCNASKQTIEELQERSFKAAREFSHGLINFTVI
jgi:hypothetical protein